MNVTEIFVDSPEYPATVELRNKILRKPIGLVPHPSEFVGEDRQWHFAAYDEHDQLCGCVVLNPLDNGVVKLRQMAVAEHAQRQGIGSALIQFAEQTAADRNIHTIKMAARVSAIPFYQRLGYSTEGTDFIEVGIPHITMKKSLLS